MTTHQEALEAARTAYQSAIPVRPWRADGGETDAPIRAAIRAYLSTLAPADNGLVEELRADIKAHEVTGNGNMRRVETLRKAADALTASQADRTALAAENERLRAALAPFADVAGEAWADENGWTDAACPKDRICDWFGPSAFRAARQAREGGNSNG